MQKSEYRALKASKYVFIFMMGVGYALRTELVRPKENYGVSNFWFKKRSKLPYIAGFTFNALGTFYVASKIFNRDDGNMKLAAGLTAKSVAATTVLASSKLLGTKRSNLHYAAGGVMYVIQVLFSGWIIWGRKSFKNLSLFSIELIGTALNLLTAANKIQQMFVGQVLAQFGYLFLLLTNLRPDDSIKVDQQTPPSQHLVL